MEGIVLGLGLLKIKNKHTNLIHNLGEEEITGLSISLAQLEKWN